MVALIIVSVVLGQGVDMSATFAKLRDCKSCTGAGYGWCTVRQMCGGFANKECGVGPQYFAKDGQFTSSSNSKPKRPRAPSPPQPQDMRATFGKLRDCSSCVDAGYGWCPMQRKCGGFANKECGIGPNYVAAGAAPRNGLWESKSGSRSKVVDSPPVADVPAASPPPPAGLLYAGPVRKAGEAASDTVDVDATTSVTVSTTGAALSAHSNETSASGFASGATGKLAEADLLALPVSSLISTILEMQSTIEAMRSKLAL